MSGIKPTQRKKKLSALKSPTKMKSTPEQQGIKADSPDASSSRFVEDLLTRGDAAERDKDGKVPLSATHVIEKKKSYGSARVKRIRFKLF